MPLSIPSLATLRGQVRANFAARIAGADQTLPVSVLNKVADAIAYPLYACYRALLWVSRQLFVSTSDLPYLIRRAGEYGVTQIQATAATGPVTLTGTDGIAVPTGTPLQTLDGSQAYTVTTGGSVGGGSVTVTVTASVGGSAGNAAAGTPLQLATAVSGINPVGVVATGGITGGTDAETQAALASRLLTRLQQPPQGGSASDFYQWARASGVPTRAWVYPQGAGVGTVQVAFVIDTRADNIPLAADIATVQSYIDAVRPVVGSCTVYAPAADALAITVHGLPSGVQAAVTAQINALVATVPPGGATAGDGVTVALPPGALFPVQTPGTLSLDMIYAAITAAAGTDIFDLIAPTADVTFASGHIPASPTITYT